MITRFITAVRTSFNPFTRSGKTARSFLALLPPDARHGMKVETQTLPRTSQASATLGLSFSALSLFVSCAIYRANKQCIEDGKEMNLDLDKLKIKDVMEEVDRHSRLLGRQEELSSGLRAFLASCPQGKLSRTLSRNVSACGDGSFLPWKESAGIPSTTSHIRGAKSMC